MMGFSEDAEQLAKRARQAERQATANARNTSLMPLAALICLMLGVVMCTASFNTVDQWIAEHWTSDGAREGLVREGSRTR